MAKEQNINMPSGFGGLMRYKDEYSSLINIKPTHVVLFVILLIGLRISLGFIFS